MDCVGSTSIQTQAWKKFSSTAMEFHSKRYVRNIHLPVYLGKYELAADAALVYDKAAALLKGPARKKNFSSMEDDDDAGKK
jgi:hypothetical protein